MSIWAAAAVLVSAAVAKLARPAASAAAFRSVRLPGHPVAVRALGLIELVIAGLVLGVGGRAAAALLVIAYTAFAVFSARHRDRPGASCGCFGETTAPLGRRHVVVDAGIALAVAPAIVVGAPGIVTITAAGAALAVIGAVALLSVAWLVQLHLTDAAALDATLAATTGGTP